MIKKDEFLEKVENQAVNSLGYIRQDKLFNLLYAGNNKVCIKPVASPVAQANKQCEARKGQEQVVIALLSNIERLRLYDRKLYYVAHLQLIGSLRISEVLELSPNQITLTGHIHVKGSKGSNDSIIFSGDAKEYLLKCKRNNVYPFADYNRFYCYRQYKKFGIKYDSNTSSKSSITHAIRHINVVSQRIENIDNVNISDHLRHKNKSNQKYYGNN